MNEYGQPAANPPSESVRAVSRLPLLVGFLAGPVIWSLHEIVSEFLIAGACASGASGFQGFTLLGASGWRFVLLLVTGFAILAVLAADIVAVRAWQQTRAGTQLTGTTGAAAGRSSWMAMAGILMSSMFLVGLVFAGLPIFWLSGCT